MLTGDLDQLHDSAVVARTGFIQLVQLVLTAYLTCVWSHV